MRKQLNENKRLQELAGLTTEKEHDFLQFNPGENKIGGGVDVKDFAIAVAKILKDQYGAHNYRRFIEALATYLRENKK